MTNAFYGREKTAFKKRKLDEFCFSPKVFTYFNFYLFEFPILVLVFGWLFLVKHV